MMQRREQYALSTGLINEGLILLFPVSTRHSLMLLDPWTYDVLCTGDICRIRDIEDIKSINILQTLNADETIFFGNTLLKEPVIKIALDSLKYKMNKSIAESTVI